MRSLGISRVVGIMTCSNPDEVEAGIPEPGSGHSFNDITVVVHDVKLVQPAEATIEETVYLTNIDLLAVEPSETFFVFLNNKERSSENVFSVLEDALARLLVPYHFMAGRLEVNLEEERLQVKCNRAGACFMVASSDQTIDELGDLKLVNPNFRKLSPPPPSDDVSPVDDFLLMVQVTRFRCGGFTVAFRNNHSVMDGMSTGQLFDNFCKLARRETLTVFPDLDRTVLRPRDPPAPEFAHPECFKSQKIPRGAGGGLYDLHLSPSDFIAKHIPMSRVEIQMLKTIAMADGSIKRCSSFEATVAHFWQARTRSLHFEPHELTKLFISVDVRPRMQPPIPPTFAGNAVVDACVIAPAAEVVRQPLSFWVAQIQQAIARIDDRYVRSAVDWLELHGGIGPAIDSTKDVLVVATSKLPFYGLDFGWGKPIHVGLAPSGCTPDLVYFAPNGDDDGGLLLMVSLQPHEMVKLERYLRTSSTVEDSKTT